MFRLRTQFPVGYDKKVGMTGRQAVLPKKATVSDDTNSIEYNTSVSFRISILIAVHSPTLSLHAHRIAKGVPDAAEAAAEEGGAPGAMNAAAKISTQVRFSFPSPPRDDFDRPLPNIFGLPLRNISLIDGSFRGGDPHHRRANIPLTLTSPILPAYQRASIASAKSPPRPREGPVSESQSDRAFQSPLRGSIQKK